MILENKNAARRKWLLPMIALGTLALMTSLAFTSRSAVQDRSVTLAEAQALAEKASQGSEFPIAMNEHVLAKLNQFVGTPEGRRYVKEGLARLPQYRNMIEEKLAERHFPKELIAIPLYESGFRSDVVSPPPYRAAGIWQFIAETAKHYHLVVDENRDERRDPEKETVAAMEYYQHLYDTFRDWRLVLRAYNEGEKHVHSLIDRYKTNDPWELEKRGSNESYLSGATAMMIILKNPSLID